MKKIEYAEHDAIIYVSKDLNKGYDRKYSYEHHDPNTFKTIIIRFDCFDELVEHPSLKRIKDKPDFSHFEIIDKRLHIHTLDGKKHQFGLFDDTDGLKVQFTGIP